MDPFEAVLNFGVPLFGGLLNGLSSASQSANYLRGVRETNQANLQIAREQNQANYEQWMRESAWNRQQWEDTNQWNLDQWRRENAYNDPSQQMARLRAAGINPYMALGQVQSGLSSSVSTSPASSASAPPAVGATMQAPSFDAYRTGISEALSGAMSMAQMRFVNAQAKKEELQGSTYLIEMMARLNQMGASAEASRASAQQSRAQAGLTNWQSKFNQDMEQYLAKQVIANVANTEQSTKKISADTSSIRQRMALENARFDLDRQLAQFNMGQTKRLNDAQIYQIHRSLDMAADRLALDWMLGKSSVEINSAQYWNIINDAAGKVLDNELKFLDKYEKRSMQKIMLPYLNSKTQLDLFEQKMHMFNPLSGFGDKALGFGLGHYFSK